ncbi:hypothetical protein [Halorhabdus rudnickae]|uniref:hypothetical protein n=1 Tax=Halorhabdus rudnickae TaxID=1775544 RepID=UPI001082BECF|nr:hypothetical protein [Halorhabdus rudnickae]
MADAGDATCPECGAALDGARSCPDCGLRIRTADDELTDDAISAVVDDALAGADDIRSPAGHAVPYSLRLGIALAISVPFAPLSAFVLVSIVSAHPIAVVLVGIVGWMAPAGVLARATVPSLIVGRGLVVLGVVVTVSPLVVVGSRWLVGETAATDPLIHGSGTLIGSFLLFGVVVLALGIVVSRVAVRKRGNWREADATTESLDRR